jgi:hypothetical protein
VRQLDVGVAVGVGVRVAVDVGNGVALEVDVGGREGIVKVDVGIGVSITVSGRINGATSAAASRLSPATIAIAMSNKMPRP